MKNYWPDAIFLLSLVLTVVYFIGVGWQAIQARDQFQSDLQELDSAITEINIAYDRLQQNAIAGEVTANDILTTSKVIQQGCVDVSIYLPARSYSYSQLIRVNSQELLRECLFLSQDSLAQLDSELTEQDPDFNLANNSIDRLNSAYSSLAEAEVNVVAVLLEDFNLVVFAINTGIFAALSWRKMSKWRKYHNHRPNLLDEQNNETEKD
jgi:hypothetical protein